MTLTTSFQGETRTRKPRGQTLVEFALVLPIFLLLLMTLIDFGRVVYAQNAISQDAREASRQGSVLAKDGSAYDLIRAAAQATSPGVEVAPTSVFGEAGDCIANFDLTVAGTCFYPDGTDIGDRVVVKIHLTIPILTPIVSNVIGGSFALDALSISYIQ